MELNYESLTSKWAPVLNEETAGEIKDSYRAKVTAAVLENQEKAMIAEGSQSMFMTETASSSNASVTGGAGALTGIQY